MVRILFFQLITEAKIVKSEGRRKMIKKVVCVEGVRKGRGEIGRAGERSLSRASLRYSRPISNSQKDAFQGDPY